MNTLDLLEPRKAYDSFLKEKHDQNVNQYFDDLTKKSGVNIEQNREICKRMYAQKDKVDKITKAANKAKRKKGFFTFLIVFSAIMIAVGIGVGVVGITSSIMGATIGGFVGAALFIGLLVLAIVFRKKTKAQIATLEDTLSKEQIKLNDVMNEASTSMAGLNGLFTEGIAPKLFEKTSELIKMDNTFNQERMQQMIDNYGYERIGDEDSSSIAVQSGTILGNPFFFERSFNMHMVPHIYEGTLTITWTTTSRDSNGGVRTTTHTQVLRATVTKPRPEYYHQTRLVYANKAAEHLSFSREPQELSRKGKEYIEKYVRKHEKELSKLAEKSLKKGQSFTPLGNSEFEFVFGGLDRDNEVEYRLLFTPLAQKAMLDLLETNEPYGDDFTFRKNKCINTVIAGHDQALNLFEEPSFYVGLDYDKMKEKFVRYNNEFFKAVFYDFAPLLSIPLYQQNKAREYIYKYNHQGNFSVFEHECLANKFDVKNLVHEDSKTSAILKTELISDKGGVDTIEITANTFDEIPQVTFVPVRGGDGKIHQVPVHWFQYDPLTQKTPMALTEVGGDVSKYNRSGYARSSSGDVAYKGGLFSYIMSKDNLNIDIKSLKDIMSKE